MRKKSSKPRVISPDPKYKSVLVSTFINKIMVDGKKGKAREIFYSTIDKISKEIEEVPGLEIFNKAIENLTPSVEVKGRKVGGSSLLIPIEVRERRKSFLSMRWLITQSRKRTEKTMAERLAKEIIEASKEKGAAYSKKIELHKSAEAHKANAHMALR